MKAWHVAMAIALLGGAAIGVARYAAAPPAAPVPAPTRETAPPAASAITPVIAMDAAGERVGRRMQADDAIADDVLFLIVASLRGRCLPERAHDLPRMAVLAHLPVLAAGGGDGAAASLRQDVAHVVKDIARRAPCHGTLALHIGGFTRELDTNGYAQAFPDSYFDPALDAPSDEFKGASLEDRIHDSCASVAYAMLPLDAPRAWQCTGLRANARTHILQLCRSEGDHADLAAADIQHFVGSLPATCR